MTAFKSLGGHSVHRIRILRDTSIPVVIGCNIGCIDGITIVGTIHITEIGGISGPHRSRDWTLVFHIIVQIRGGGSCRHHICCCIVHCIVHSIPIIKCSLHIVAIHHRVCLVGWIHHPRRGHCCRGCACCCVYSFHRVHHHLILLVCFIIHLISIQHCWIVVIIVHCVVHGSVCVVCIG